MSPRRRRGRKKQLRRAAKPLVLTVGAFGATAALLLALRTAVSDEFMEAWDEFWRRDQF